MSLALGTLATRKKRGLRIRDWGAWVRRNRKQQGMTMRELAEACCIDASYLTLIERDGFVPSRDVCENIGRVLDSPEAALIECLMLPASMKTKAIAWLARMRELDREEAESQHS